MTLPPIAMPGEARPQEPDMVLALEDIIFGRLVPGSRPVEDALIARFGGSRHYVRQALDRLERLGLAVRERNKGFTVRSLTPAQVAQIYEMRELVQRQAALLIPLPAPRELVRDLLALNAELAGHMAATTCAACTTRTTGSISACSAPAATSTCWLRSRITCGSACRCAPGPWPTRLRSRSPTPSTS
jgi:hypothetical protein